MEKTRHITLALPAVLAFLALAESNAGCQTGRISVYPTVVEWSADDMSPQEVRVTTDGTWVCDSLEMADGSGSTGQPALARPW